MISIRPAKISDVAEICRMVNYYAERGRMLHRSLESVYDSLREFQVALDEDRVIGCVAVDVFWADLAELKSLAVAPTMHGKGIGKLLVHAAVVDAKRIGVKKLFALTYETEFFVRQGFEIINRMDLPDKVWRECVKCAKADACDETAVLMRLDRRRKRAPAAKATPAKPRKKK